MNDGWIVIKEAVDDVGIYSETSILWTQITYLLIIS